jgi:capsid protein
VSWLKTALPHARDLHEIFGYEKVGAKFAAMWSAFIKKRELHSDASASKWDANGVNSVGKQIGYMTAEPGKIGKIGQDEDIQFAPGVQRPSGAFINLIEAVIHHIALGLNLPYGFVYKMSSFGGVTARLETSQAQRTFERWQRLMEDKFLNRVRDQVLSLAIVNGKIPPHPNYKKGSWRFGAHITADIQHQTNADVQLIAAGLMTRSEWCAEHDKDFADTQRTLAQEMNIMRQVCAEAEIPIELLHEAKPQATELLAAMATRNEPPPPEPTGLVNKGVDIKGLVDILENNSMDRESKIHSIVEIYGVDYKQASLMVPSVPAALDIDAPIVAKTQ